MRASTSILLTLCLGLVGCTIRPATLSLPSLGGAQRVSDVAAPAGSTQAEANEYGTLTLDVRWPDRVTSNYRAQVIPNSSNALIVLIRGAGTYVNNPSAGISQYQPGPILVQQTLPRLAGASTASASFQLKAANNLSVEVDAYQESGPTYGVSTILAQGTAGINIQPSQNTSANVTLASRFVPTIQNLSTNIGLAGDTITITGTNFGSSSIAVPLVTFNGATASSVVRNSDTSLTVGVPQGVTSGALLIKADGVPTNSNFTFWVPSSLSISAPKASWDTQTGANGRAVVVGHTLQFSATPTWVTGSNTFFMGGAPQPTWSCDNQTAGSLSASGLFTAGSTYATGVVSARLASVTSNTLNAVAEDATVTLVAPATVLGAKGASALQLTAYNTMSDGATNSLLTYSGASGVSVDGNGVASASFTANGAVTVTASSSLNPARFATASVTLSNYVVSKLAGHNSGTADGEAKYTAGLSRPFGLAVDSSGTVYFSQYFSGNLRKVANDTVTTLSITMTASSIGRLAGIALDEANNVMYACDDANQRVYQIALNSNRTAGTASIWVGDPNGSAGFADGTTQAARFRSPEGLALDAARHLLFVTDLGNNVIRQIDTTTGNVTTIAGTPGTSGNGNGPTGLGNATLNGPVGLALGPNQTLYVMQVDGNIRKVDTSGSAGVTSVPLSRTITQNNANYSSPALYCNPLGIAVDGAGTMFVSEQGGIPYNPSLNLPRTFMCNVIDRVAPDGTVTTIAGDNSYIYPTNGTSYPPMPNYNDGVGTTASFCAPGFLAFDSTGHLYAGDYYNDALRIIK